MQITAGKNGDEFYRQDELTGQGNSTLATVQSLIRHCDSINRSVWQLEVVRVEGKMEQNLKG